jgi:hypothetical protein
MRAKSSFVLVAVVALASMAAVESHAMYTPNPAARWAANRLFVAADLQYNGDKDLDRGGEIDDEIGFYGRPSYAFAQNATIYGRIGFQDADGVDTEFAIGGGLQAAWVLPNAQDWTIGASFDYLYWDVPGDYHEIQIAPAVGYNIPSLRELTPYAGLAFDFLVEDYEEDDPVGVLLGSTFDVGDRIRLDGQVRFINESGFSISAGYLF